MATRHSEHRPPDDALAAALAQLLEVNERLVATGERLRQTADTSRTDAEAARVEALAARAEADDANRRKDEFLAMLGHELRNPLGPIFTAVQLLKLRGSESRELAIIERQAGHLARLIADLMDVSRITRGTVELHRQSLELSAVIVHAIETISPMLEQRRQTLDLDVAPEGLIVMADPDRLGQVFANLLDNASKFSPANSTIRVSAVRGDTTAIVRIADEGVGIEPEMLESMFDSFVQQRQALDRRQGGLGLGLAIARNLTRLHGGTLRASSAGPGRGSQFTTEIPLVVPGRTAQPDLTADEVAKNGHGTRILVVDDNADAVDTVGQLLRELGYQVETAQDGSEALSVAPIFQPQVVLLDLGLPEMDGYEVASRMRALNMGSAPTFVALSGYGQDSDRQRSERAGFTSHLVKPVDVEALKGALEAAASRQRH